MKIAFLTEMGFTGKIPINHTNMRTEFAWMYALNSDHYNILQYESVKNYDAVIVLLPQGNVMVDCHGVELSPRKNDVLGDVLQSNIIHKLKESNRIVCHMQEGPIWLFNEYSLEVQFNYYNQLAECDIILAHNESDTTWYKGLFPTSRVEVMPSLMIEHHLQQPLLKSESTIIGGNFSRWYGGFQSYIVANAISNDIWVQDSHSKRTHEDMVPNLNHLPRLSWVEWMNRLASFKYAIHLMPTIAAGTFSLNCAYYGIPCIGNKKMDTQLVCHPDLSVDVDDVQTARNLALKLRNDEEFYLYCSNIAKENYRKHYDIQIWKDKMSDIFKPIN
jgi:hypothetical protein